MYTYIYVPILKYIKNHQFRSIPLISIQHNRVYSSFDSPSLYLQFPFPIIPNSHDPHCIGPIFSYITILLPLPTHKCPHLSRALIPNSKPLVATTSLYRHPPHPALGPVPHRGHHLSAPVLTWMLVGFT